MVWLYLIKHLYFIVNYIKMTLTSRPAKLQVRPVYNTPEMRSVGSVFSSCPQCEPKHTNSKHWDCRFVYLVFFVVALFWFSAQLWSSWSAVAISAHDSSSSSDRSATCDWNQSWKPAWVLQVSSSCAVSDACRHLRRSSSLHDNTRCLIADIVWRDHQGWISVTTLNPSGAEQS